MQKKTLLNLFTPVYLAVWLAFSLYIAAFHEPFGDEAQSFLIARDAGLAELLSTVARTEGTPVLWHLWLKLLLSLGLPYKLLYLASIIPAFAAVAVFVCKAPFPVSVRFLFPLTYYVFFQYNIIARSYSLLFLMVTVVALCHQQRLSHPLRYVAALMLLGSVSAHALILSCGLFAMFALEQWKNRRFCYPALFLFVLFILFSSWMLWPDAGNMYIQSHIGKKMYFPLNLFFTMSCGLVNSYFLFPENLLFVDLGLLFFALAAYALFRLDRRLFAFIFLPNLLLMVVVPYHPWHSGIFILSALLVFWLAPRPNPFPLYVRILVAYFLIVQIMWSAFAFYREKNEAYSGTVAMYRFMQQQQIAPEEVYAMVFNSVALHPYIGRPEYSWWNWQQKGYAIPPQPEKMLRYRAFIVNQEAYDAFKGEIESVAEKGSYRRRFFYGSQFFALQEMPLHESFYLFYRGPQWEKE